MTSTQKKAQDKRPVTYGALDPLMTAIKLEFNQITERLDRVEGRLDQTATKDDLRGFKDDIIREFKVTAENIHQDVAGANKDEISSIKDSVGKLDERMQVVEKRVGIPTPPATP